ncbi:MAG: chaperonin family protein RbcX [Thermostichales cyanobacterium DRC_bins_46]
MDIKRIAKATTQTLISYLTYQAVRVVIEQLKETDPPRSLWLHQFSSQERIQDGEVYLQALMGSQQELALRIMTVRAHLAEEIREFLPEMLMTEMQAANARHRRSYLERLTQLSLQDPPPDQVE